jgi:hypothetical protein
MSGNGLGDESSVQADFRGMGLADRDYMRRHPELLYDKGDEPLVLLERPGLGSLLWQVVVLVLLGIVIVAVLSPVMGWVGGVVAIGVVVVVALRRAS